MTITKYNTKYNQEGPLKKAVKPLLQPMPTIPEDTGDTEEDTDFCRCYLDERLSSECEDPGQDPLELGCITNNLNINNTLDWFIPRGEPLPSDAEAQWKVWNSLPCQDKTHFTTEFAIKDHGDCDDDCKVIDICTKCELPKLRQCGCSLCITPLERLCGSSDTEGCANPHCGKATQDYKGLGEGTVDRLLLSNVKEVRLSDLGHYYCDDCWTFIEKAELTPCVLCLGFSCN